MEMVHCPYCGYVALFVNSKPAFENEELIIRKNFKCTNCSMDFTIKTVYDKNVFGGWDFNYSELKVNSDVTRAPEKEYEPRHENVYVLENAKGNHLLWDVDEEGESKIIYFDNSGKAMGFLVSLLNEVPDMAKEILENGTVVISRKIDVNKGINCSELKPVLINDEIQLIRRNEDEG